MLVSVPTNKCLVMLVLAAALLGASSAEEPEVATGLLAILEFDPAEMTLMEDEYKDVSLSLRVNHSASLWEHDNQSVVPPWLRCPGQVTVQSDDTFRLDVLNGTFNVTPQGFLSDEGNNQTVTLHSYNLGYVNLIVFWERLWSEPCVDPEQPTAAGGGNDTSDPAAEPQPVPVDDVPNLESDNVPELEFDDDVPEPEFDDDVPEQESPDNVPEQESPDDVPEPEFDDDVPEPESDDDVPEPEFDDDVPEPEFDDYVPEQESPDDVPEPESADDVPEPESPDDIPENDPSDPDASPQVRGSDGPAPGFESPEVVLPVTRAVQIPRRDPTTRKMVPTTKKSRSDPTTPKLVPTKKPRSGRTTPKLVPTKTPRLDPTTATKKPRPKKKKKEEEKVNIYTAGATFMFLQGHDLTAEQPEATATRIYFTDSGHNEYRVKILRDAGTMDMMFVIVISVFVGINTLMMGCQIDLNDVWAVLKKPVGPVVGFVSQFLFMPLASYGLAHLLLTGSNIQLGLFTLGCSPGGNGSNFWTLLLKGDLNLSMTMTFISTSCAIFMMPLWLYTLGQNILKRGQITIPFSNLIMSLVTFTVPVAIGVIIRKYKPTWADFIRKLIRPFTFILLIALNVLAVWNSMYIFRLMTWQMLVAGMSIAWGGYLFGASMAFLFRQKRPQIIAIAIETAIQNPGVTFMVLRLTLKQPDADMSAVAPVAQLLVTTLPLLLLYLVFMVYRKCKACRDRRKEEEAEQDAKEKGDVDVIDPLLVKRVDSAAPPPNGIKEASADLGPALNAKERQDLMAQRPHRNGVPPFPNMYSELDEKELTRRYVKVPLTNQASLDDDPRRTSEPRYVNFKNGKMYPITDEESPV